MRVYVALHNQECDHMIVEGFITFIHVDEEGKPLPHGLTLKLVSDQDKDLSIRAKNLD